MEKNRYTPRETLCDIEIFGGWSIRENLIYPALLLIGTVSIGFVIVAAMIAGAHIVVYETTSFLDTYKSGIEARATLEGEKE